MKIDAVRVTHRYPLSFKKYPNDAGYDMYAISHTILWPFVPKRIPLNIKASIPEGVFGRICGRSGLNAEGICVLPGTVDSGYTGQIFAVTVNLSLIPRRIRKGDRIAQLIFIPFYAAEIREVQDLPATARGDSALGSTGRR
ncbi:MAG: dUTP diphosphatase [Firmicutes bacterium]|nr:dUTP diphosphatase [Bacillota bacterium]